MMAQTERDDLLFALSDFLFGARCAVVTAGLPGLVSRLIHVSLDLAGCGKSRLVMSFWVLM
jgi:hypothetical protein